ncbi:amino-acid transporter subunit; membrane component of ABC superfamily [Methylocella tundrae]|uniref:Amino-acid transporter subunit membrane component of ABC superfamily n=1 Tax=Methylocella tundrae TaxID=227605 RepID=A0A8B6M7B5_METTU|nr:ABC transporter permease subunit [Methylocella tundrae]VTZ50200.1 amino-acid transporter subunit; membrane component of ABC superfamily [Methylocella tundrae]
MAEKAGFLTPGGDGPGHVRRHPALALWYDAKARAALIQLAFVIGFAALAAMAFLDVRDNMQARGIATDFSFLGKVAGFDINQSLIPYSAASTYGRAFVVGLLNTCLVGALGLIFATIIGFSVGFARLSKNWIVARCAMAYVETLRNVPLLLQLLFWYNAVLKPLPPPRESLELPFGLFLNNRGLFAPEPVFGGGAVWILLAALVSCLGAIALRSMPARRKFGSDRAAFLSGVAAALLLVLPLAAFVIAGNPIDFVRPELRGFNFSGGVRLLPEFVALVLGLSLYTGAFIAEIVRAGVEAVPRGQREAAAALGLSAPDANRLIIAPQAMRLIIPLLTSQYLNLIKNSSLAVFIGYPDLVQIFAGTVLNQTGAAVQVIVITMAVYLAISLLASLAMNLYARRFALKER